MSATAVCPACGHTNAGPQVIAGSLIRCSNCQQSFQAKRSMGAPPVSSFAPAPLTANPNATPQYSPPSYSAPGSLPGIPGAFAPDLKPASGPSAADNSEPSGLVAFLAMFALVGVMVVLCGGAGAYFAMTGNEDEIAVAEPPQSERVAEVQPPEPPRPPVVAPPQRIVRDFPPVTPPPPETSPVPVTPPSFTPPRPMPITPPTIPTPPGIPPGSAIPPMDPPGRTFPPPGFRPPGIPGSERGPMGPMTDDQRIDEVIRQLNDSAEMRPKFVPLSELGRIPVQEKRRADVAAALDPHLNSQDIGTALAAYRAAETWGTETNVASITAALDHSNQIVRWHAIRLLPKLSPTAETAEALATRVGDFSLSGPLRDAFFVLGATGEPALIKQLETGDLKTKQAVVDLLDGIGTEASRAALQKVVDTESDFSLKSRAGRALRRIETRGKK